VGSDAYFRTFLFFEKLFSQLTEVVKILKVCVAFGTLGFRLHSGTKTNSTYISHCQNPEIPVLTF
jgi:hypothetical protein